MKLTMKLAAVIASSAVLNLPAIAEENEVEIALKDAPPAVQTTIYAQAQGAKIAEVEVETKEGKKVYEADIIKADGTKVEIAVSQNGTLLSRKTDKEDSGEKGEKDKD